MVYLNSLSYSRQTSNERRRTEHYHMKNKEKIDESHKSQLKFEYKIYILNKCTKKLWFIHELTAHYTSKTAKITKR